MPKLCIANQLNKIGKNFRISMKEIQKLKATKLQTYIGQFEQLKMKEDENIATYFLRVDETMNAIIGLGEIFDETIIFQKVLRFLLMRFDPKILALEERAYLGAIGMDELY
jgi:ubiquinone biosynthesis protein Coq4